MRHQGIVRSIIASGDRDDGALDASLFMARTMRYVGIVMLPFTGHTPNLEEPLLFNLHVGEFLAAVSEGRWATWRGGSSSGAEGEANADRDQ